MKAGHQQAQVPTLQVCKTQLLLRSMKPQLRSFASSWTSDERKLYLAGIPVSVGESIHPFESREPPLTDHLLEWSSSTTKIHMGAVTESAEDSVRSSQSSFRGPSGSVLKRAFIHLI
ncbi:hypothetical protein FVE85_0743 [Porphyridium purpureum]|uniref:Uncharacterized protein n=1 Tax=Porphyridium purpureum TaxID=35688 RepID=A0A5J4Z266_PORPP|nr:hypothetical protein FVE85_0743 [Porphyridium purpureum]|eukprot:POR9258..scf208_2